MNATTFKALSERRSDVFHVPLAHVVEVEGWNVREMDTAENQSALLELADSIREVGVKEPLTGYVKDGGVIVTNGHRRLRAVQMLVSQGEPILTLPFQAEPRHADEAARVASMLVRNSGKSLTPLETSKVVVRLVDFGWAVSKIAACMGKTVSYVNQLLQLQAAAPEVKEMVRKGEVAASVAVRTTRREGGVDILREAVEKAKKQGKARATPKAVASVEAAAPQAPTGIPQVSQYQEELYAAAALLISLASPARYAATPPPIWPYSNALWFQALSRGTQMEDIKVHIAQAEALK